MSMMLMIQADLFNVLAGNRSIVDLERLTFKSKNQAVEFLKAYGFDIFLEEDAKKLIYYYRRAIVFLTEKLEIDVSDLPQNLENISDIKTWVEEILWRPFGDVTDLVPLRQRLWACAILRVMHAFVHAENDLFHLFSEEIQKQTMSAFERTIQFEGSGRPVLRGTLFGDEYLLPLYHFEVKPHKTSVSSVIKLLAKAETHMIDIHDKIGIRFVTEYFIDVLILLQMLVENHLVAPAHVMAGQTTNDLLPVPALRNFLESQPFFLSEIRDVFRNRNQEELQRLSGEFEHFLRSQENLEVVKKENRYSSLGYQFIKFVERKMIRLPPEKGGGRFFYPFEVQIFSREGYERSRSGEAEHGEYKKRQIQAARARVSRGLLAASLNESDKV